MRIKKIENINKGKNIKADLYSRPNAMNGKYKIGQLGLDNFATIQNDDIFFLETLEMKANLADKMITEAELLGKNTNDLNVMKNLGAEINALATPLHKSEVIMTAIFVALRLSVYYGVAMGIWWLVLGKSFLGLGFYSVIAIVFLISLFFASPLIFQRTKESLRDQIVGMGVIWVPLGVLISIIGIIAFVLRVMFF
ncbi:MAG: hypothetical protein WCT11_01745 [Candidatus Magasanikbacteria bacterium]